MKKQNIGLIICAILLVISVFMTGCMEEEVDCNMCGGTGEVRGQECGVCDGTGKETQDSPGFELVGVAGAIGLCIAVIGWRKSRKNKGRK